MYVVDDGKLYCFGFCLTTRPKRKKKRSKMSMAVIYMAVPYRSQ